jgi:cobalt-zinc-cadmium efflux system membrane fusion protein
MRTKHADLKDRLYDRRRRRAIVACLAVAGLLASSMACRQQTVPTTESTPEAKAGETHAEEENAIHLGADMVRDLRISTALVSERPGARQVSVLGEIAADQSLYAEVAPPTGGQVVRVLVELNASVDQGTPLAQLRSSELGRARADLLSAEARRDLAQQTLDRRRTLAAERIVARREAEEAEAAFRAADAEVRAARTALRALGIDEGDAADDGSLFFVRSPLPGRVIDRRAILGQYADTTAPLFTVADLARVWLIAQVFERDAVNLRAGSVAHITLAALPGREFDGRVTQVGRQVDAGSRTVPVRVELTNPNGMLRPGMSAGARLEVAGETERILVVPAAALQRVGDQWLAFVPVTPQEFEMRPVGRGRDLGNDVEVVSGLKAGETVVVEGAFLLKAEAEKRAGGADEHGH